MKRCVLAGRDVDIYAGGVPIQRVVKDGAELWHRATVSDYVTDGLVAHYDFENNAGIGSHTSDPYDGIVDLSGNGHDLNFSYDSSLGEVENVFKIKSQSVKFNIPLSLPLSTGSAYWFSTKKHNPQSHGTIEIVLSDLSAPNNNWWEHRFLKISGGATGPSVNTKINGCDLCIPANLKNSYEYSTPPRGNLTNRSLFNGHLSVIHGDWVFDEEGHCTSRFWIDGAVSNTNTIDAELNNTAGSFLLCWVNRWSSYQKFSLYNAKYYDRILTEDEIKNNVLVSQLRFKEVEEWA